jgi:hypothetical protein
MELAEMETTMLTSVFQSKMAEDLEQSLKRMASN